MKRLFGFLFILVLLVVGAVIAAPLLISADRFKPQIEARLSEQLGRKVSIGDDLKVQLFPRPAFSVDNLVVSNPEGFSDRPFLVVQSADIGVELFPLFSRQVDVTRFVLTQPEIRLEKLGNGAENWAFDGEGAADANGGDKTPDDRTQVNELAFGDVRIVDGQLAYTDQQSGQRYTLSDINVNADLDGLASPFRLKGALIYKATPVTLDLVMTTLGTFLNGEPADLKLDLGAGPSTIGGDLKLSRQNDTIRFAGPISVNLPDLPGFIALVSEPLPETPGFDRLQLSGRIDGSPDDFGLSGADVQFDSITSTGELRVASRGPRPKITGELSTGRLDLRPYLPAPVTDQEGFPEWSEAPFDFSGLRAVDADLAIVAQEIYVNQIRTGQSRLDIEIDNGRLTADLPQFAMYEGSGSGRLVVNARGSAPTLAGNFKFDQLAAEPFAIDVLNINRILGIGGFAFDFSLTGKSQAEWMRTLDGTGSFDIIDGSLRGANLGKLARIAYGFSEGLNVTGASNAISVALGPEQVTDFSSLLSKFAMENGIVTAQTIDLKAPFLTIEGGGTVDLPRQSQAIRLTLQARRDTSGDSPFGPALPLAIGGTFNNPTIDYGALISGLLQGAAGDQLRGVLEDALGDDIKNSPAGGLLDSVLDEAIGRKPAAPKSQGEKSKSPVSSDAAKPDLEDVLEETAKEALGGLFQSRTKTSEPASEPAEETEPPR